VIKALLAARHPFAESLRKLTPFVLSQPLTFPPDQEVKLSPKEYDLLRVLIQHAGKVLTRRFPLRELWDELTDPQYLRVYVRQLRQKVEADPERPQHILTETGIGYRLRAPDA